ncbi:hypothetical protein TNCV_3001031 [Trichonephila clavipes]|nr:hypothetical protein TNCV_3001031 [Trichonephila clavipes]
MKNTETQRNVSPSEQEEDERGPMQTSAIKDLLKKVGGWSPERINRFHIEVYDRLTNNSDSEHSLGTDYVLSPITHCIVL